MATLIHGDRIGRDATVQFGCSAFVPNESGAKVLLTRRTDNGRWCLPGGRMDPGESAAETCVREVLEETGLQVEVVRLIGLYSSPNVIIAYADGKAQPQPFYVRRNVQLIFAYGGSHDRRMLPERHLLHHAAGRHPDLDLHQVRFACRRLARCRKPLEKIKLPDQRIVWSWLRFFFQHAVPKLFLPL